MIRGYPLSQDQSRLTRPQIMFINELAKMELEAREERLENIRNNVPDREYVMPPKKDVVELTTDDFFEKFAPDLDELDRIAKHETEEEIRKAKAIWEDFKKSNTGKVYGDGIR